MNRRIQLTLQDRLDDLIAKDGRSANIIANAIDINPSMLSKYRSGADKPALDTLVKIAQFFGKSTDYLLGLSDAESLAPDKNNAEKYLGLSPDAISRIREAGLTRNALHGGTDIQNWFFTSGYYLSLLVAAENYKNYREKCNNQRQYLTLDYSQLDNEYIMAQAAKLDMVEVALQMARDIDTACDEGVKKDGKH